jgi:hypothetical protein
MSRYVGFLAAAAVLAVATSEAQAGRPRGGSVSTPFGTANTNSAEWRMAGGNPFLYDQIMQQKMLMQQQQAWLKMQQQMAKSNNGKVPVTTPALPAVPHTRRKKRRTYVPTGPAIQAAPTTGTTAFPPPTRVPTTAAPKPASKP